MGELDLVLLCHCLGKNIRSWTCREGIQMLEPRSENDSLGNNPEASWSLFSYKRSRAGASLLLLGCLFQQSWDSESSPLQVLQMGCRWPLAARLWCCGGFPCELVDVTTATTLPPRADTVKREGMLSKPRYSEFFLPSPALKGSELVSRVKSSQWNKYSSLLRSVLSVASLLKMQLRKIF